MANKVFVLFYYDLDGAPGDVSLFIYNEQTDARERLKRMEKELIDISDFADFDDKQGYIDREDAVFDDEDYSHLADWWTLEIKEYIVQ